ncbi:hypothetical protein PAXINDRAFT_54076, partial [Paxillus involutus ATCC 200175]
RRAPNQRVAHAILQMSNPQAANSIVRDGVYVCKEKLHPTKDKCAPIRCVWCQHWDHIARNCKAQHDTCAICRHRHHTDNCSLYMTYHCVSCDIDNHSSNDPPTYKDRCVILNAKHPENSMPYFPTDEPW